MIDRVIVALDFNKKEDALRVVDELDGLVDFFKVGLELFISEGPEIIKILKKRNKRVFLDLKLHDIPNTVSKAVRTSLNYDVEMLTIHSTGGFEMMKRAKEILEEQKIKENLKTKIIAVSVLTSLDRDALKEIFGFPIDVRALVLNLASLSKKAGLDGAVASAREVREIKNYCGKEFIVVTPGIRIENSASDDQKRTATVKEAFSSGADYVVIGRAITLSSNPKEVLQRVLKN